MRIQITHHYLQQTFVDYSLDWPLLLESLQLDLGHVQLVRDFARQWPERDPALLFVLLALVDAVNRGSLCLKLSEQRFQQLARRLGWAQISTHVADLDLSSYLLHGAQILRLEADRLYFIKYQQQEQELQHSLLALINNNQSSAYEHGAIKDHVSAVVSALPYVLEGQQIQAILTAVLQPFSIISGGPGTGKTTILLSLLRVITRLGLPPEAVALAAPTGRAAYRMTETLRLGLSQELQGEKERLLGNIEATTIHRLLGANPNKMRNRYHAKNLLPYRLIVIDEVSMVDLMLMNQLIQAISLDTRLVFLGDQFQLPSVHTGAMLADLMPPVNTVGLNSQSFVDTLKLLWPAGHVMPAIDMSVTEQVMMDRVTVLTVSKRSQPAIAQLSEAVRQGNEQLFFQAPIKMLDVNNLVFGAGAVNWVDAPDNDYHTWLAVLQAWLDKHYIQANAQGHTYSALLSELFHLPPAQLLLADKYLRPTFDLINSQRILTFMNLGRRGADFINRQWSAWLQNRLQVTGSETVFHGAVIMVQRNDKALALFNGDVGVVIETATQQYSVVFQQSVGYKIYSVHVIPQFKLAFAMTVHKSQGSEFQHVLMPLPEQTNNRLLTREILYTGMTRAKQSVCFYGNEQTIKTGIKRRTKRHSGLAFWYNENSFYRDE